MKSSRVSRTTTEQLRNARSFDSSSGRERGAPSRKDVPELARAEIRETYLRTYRVVYRANETGVCVLTVFEGSRLLRRSDIDDP